MAATLWAEATDMFRQRDSGRETGAGWKRRSPAESSNMPGQFSTRALRLAVLQSARTDNGREGVRRGSKDSGRY